MLSATRCTSCGRQEWIDPDDGPRRCRCERQGLLRPGRRRSTSIVRGADGSARQGRQTAEVAILRRFWI